MGSAGEAGVEVGGGDCRVWGIVALDAARFAESGVEDLVVEDGAVDEGNAEG